MLCSTLMDPPFSGLLNFNKPTGITSAKALYRVRRITGLRKSGHAGTLDPAADGVLLLCFGKGTKRVERLMDLPKSYHAVGRLDVTSASFDSDSPHQPVDVATVPTANAVTDAATQLVGAIQQIPPVVSAIKVGGKPSYRLARTGKPPELAARTVQVYGLAITHFAWPEVRFDVHCGRGTYVRALIRDLGALLGTGGCLTGLTRTAIGPFRLADSTSFEDLEAGLFSSRRMEVEQLDALLDEVCPRQLPGDSLG